LRARGADGAAHGGIDVVERVGLSLACSLVVVPLVVIADAASQWDLFGTVLFGATAVTLLLAQIGAVRRARVPPSARLDLGARVRSLAGAETGAVASVTGVILLVAIVVAGGSLVFSVVAPVSTGGFSELGIYTTTDDGELTAGGFPDEVAPNEPVPVTISVENQHDEARTYTVVIQEQQVTDDAVVDRTELGRIDGTVDPGSTSVTEQTVTPTADLGETVRISILLYEGAPPAQPTNQNADETAFFWVSVPEDPDVILPEDQVDDSNSTTVDEADDD
jgi:uncharacterized membrane protein